MTRKEFAIAFQPALHVAILVFWIVAPWVDGGKRSDRITLIIFGWVITQIWFLVALLVLPRTRDDTESR